MAQAADSRKCLNGRGRKQIPPSRGTAFRGYGMGAFCFSAVFGGQGADTGTPCAGQKISGPWGMPTARIRKSIKSGPCAAAGTKENEVNAAYAAPCPPPTPFTAYRSQVQYIPFTGACQSDGCRKNYFFRCRMTSQAITATQMPISRLGDWKIDVTKALMK